MKYFGFTEYGDNAWLCDVNFSCLLKVHVKYVSSYINIPLLFISAHTFADMAKAPSVWSYVSTMRPENFRNVYGDFPQKVRQHLGEWLENQPW